MTPLQIGLIVLALALVAVWIGLRFVAEPIEQTALASLAQFEQRLQAKPLTLVQFFANG